MGSSWASLGTSGKSCGDVRGSRNSRGSLHHFSTFLLRFWLPSRGSRTSESVLPCTRELEFHWMALFPLRSISEPLGHPFLSLKTLARDPLHPFLLSKTVVRDPLHPILTFLRLLIYLGEVEQSRDSSGGGQNSNSGVPAIPSKHTLGHPPPPFPGIILYRRA